MIGGEKAVQVIAFVKSEITILQEVIREVFFKYCYFILRHRIVQ